MSKAKIKKTGEIVDIICYSCTTSRGSHDSVSYIDSRGVEHEKEPLNYYWDFEEILNLDSNIDWERERCEIAKEILIALLTHPDINDSYYTDERFAVVRADSLIKVLKEKA